LKSGRACERLLRLSRIENRDRDRLRVRRGASAAPIEKRAGKPRIGFGGDPFVDQLLQFLAKVGGPCEPGEFNAFKGLLRALDQIFHRRTGSAHEVASESGIGHMRESIKARIVTHAVANAIVPA